MTDAKPRNYLNDITLLPINESFAQPIYLVSTMPCRIPSSPPPVIIILVFLLYLLISTNAYPVNSPPTRFCPNSTCGKQVIAYPFWIAPDLFTTPFTLCGYPRLMLICQDDNPILSIGSNNYTVSNIDYRNQTVSLADTDVRAAGICPRPQHNVTLMDTTFPNYTLFQNSLKDVSYQIYLNYTPLDTNLTFFLNCSDGPPERRITCFSGSGGKESYVFTERDFLDNKEYERVRECQDIVVVPVLDQEVNWGNLSALSSDLGRVLNQGFQLGWSNETLDVCDSCELSGGRCGFEITKTSLSYICFCSNRTSDRYCGTHRPKKMTIMIGAFIASGLSLIRIISSMQGYDMGVRQEMEV